MNLGVDRRVLTLSLAQLAESVGNSFLIIVLPLYIASGTVEGGLLGMDEVMVTGVVLSLSGFVSSFFQRPFGVASDSLGRRKIFVVSGLALLAVASFAYSLTESYASLLGVRALQGVAAGMIIPSAIALVNEFSASGVRGGSMGVYNTFRLVGFGAGPVAAGAVVNAGPYAVLGREIAGYDAAFYFAAATAATSLVLVSIFIHDPEETIQTGHSGPSSFRVFDDDGGLDPVFTLGLVTLFMAIGIALFATIQVNINEHLDQGSTWFGLQFSAFIVAQVLLQTPVGSASDRWGRKPFVFWGLVFLVPTTFAQGLVTTSVGMFVARLLQGVAGAMVFAPALALAGDLARGDSGSKLSVLTTAFALGVAIGPLSSGYLISYGLVVPFAFGAVLAGIGAVLVWSEIEETVGVETS